MDRKIEMGHALALLAISNASQQFDAARQMAVTRMRRMVRETEEKLKLVKKLKSLRKKKLKLLRMRRLHQ